jgi:hypothetical protein
MTIDIVGGRPAQVVKPSQVRLTEPHEFARFASGSTRGHFFDWWRLNEDGTFTDLRRHGEE